MDFQLFGLSPTFKVKNRRKISAKCQNRRKFSVKMATITTEYGKLSSNKTRTVYLRFRSGKTEKRINTQIKVLESEVMKKGVLALTLEELMKVYHYQGNPGSRAQLARDTFILSFCLMGMNSVDLFSATNYKNGFIKYNRTKTKDRRLA